MADFSPCRKYRFRLERNTGLTSQKAILFIMLNPSTSDETKNDRTTVNICKIAKKWNYGKVYVGNLNPFCSPHPSDLKSSPLPNDIKEINEKHIREMAEKSHIIVYAWGNDYPYGNKLAEPDWLKTITKGKAYCIRKTVKDSPMHPRNRKVLDDWVPLTPTPFS
jgi:hypothetical protein